MNNFISTNRFLAPTIVTHPLPINPVRVRGFYHDTLLSPLEKTDLSAAALFRTSVTCLLTLELAVLNTQLPSWIQLGLLFSRKGALVDLAPRKP